MIGVYDKGKVGTVVETEQLLVEKGGKKEVYTRIVGSAVFIGQGNWGGPKGPSTEAFPPPEGRTPDGAFELKLSDEAALLYRWVVLVRFWRSEAVRRWLTRTVYNQVEWRL